MEGHYGGDGPLSGTSASERYVFHRQLTRNYALGAALFVPLPGLAFLGLGYARPVLWLNKIRKADDPVEYATKTKWRKYKTAKAVGTVTGSVSIVGYYRDQYVQDAAWKLIQGEKPEDVVSWMKDEHEVPHQKAISIILQLHEERREFLKSGLGGRTSRAGTEARSFYDMDGLSLLKSMSSPTPRKEFAPASSTQSPGSIFRGSGMTKGDSGVRRGARTRTRPWWFSTKAKRRISRKRS